MPKDRRGGRSLKRKPYNDYNVIGTANNGTIKVLKVKPGVKNASVPLFSNKANTVYFIAKPVAQLGNADTITSIAIYRKRQIVANVDIDMVQGYHYHTWKAADANGINKPQRNKKHNYNLKPVHQKLIQMALNWNNGGK